MRPARKILGVVVTGSVAAVKTFLLADALRARGFELRFVVTESAWQFLKTEGKYAATPEQLATLPSPASLAGEGGAHRPFLGDGRERAIPGLSDSLPEQPSPPALSREERERGLFSACDAILIAPASADFIRQIARGDTDISRAIKDAGRPVLIAPAMNFMMWQHPAVQDNVRRVLDAGMKILGPDCGDMACGDNGFGRMSGPAAIAEAVEAVLQGKNHALVDAGKKALIEHAALPSRARSPCRKVLLAAFSDAPLPEGYNVQCIVPPENAKRVPELQKSTAHPVVSAHYQLYPRDGMEHIWLPEDSDVVVLQGLTGTYAAEMAKGAAESFIGCVYLATKRPVIVIPSADCAEADLAAIKSHGAIITDEAGLSHAIESLEQEEPSGFEGKKFLVLGGHARETVDSFRFYANTARPEDHGARVARELEARGAEVVFLSASVSAAELLAQARVLKDKNFEAVVQLAGISQFTCPAPVAHKISKTGDERARLFEVEGNIDVIAGLRDIFGAGKVMGYDNFQEGTEGAGTPLKHKIMSFVRRSAKAPLPAGEGLGRGATAGFVNTHPAIAPLPGPLPEGEGALRIVVTTGRTEEKITRDGVVITNGFTGRQGQEIARAFAERGMDVALISGPTALPDVDHPRVRTVHTVSMQDMLAAVLREIATPVDVFVSAAAIADFSVRDPLSLRLLPGAAHRLEMSENLSVVETAARHDPRPKTVVSFAAQSPETVLEYACKKFKKSGADLTVANPIGAGAATTRDSTRNEASFICRKNGEIVAEKLEEMSKGEVAREIVKRVTSF